MAFRLCEGVHLTPTGSGVLIHTPRGRTDVDDPSMYRWLASLLPLLDGSHALDDLIGAFPPREEAKVRQAVSVLRRAEAVVDRAAEDDHTLRAWELAEYRNEIRFLDQHRSSAARAFEAYRDTTGLVIGAGELALACVRGLVATGTRVVRVAVPAASDRRAFASLAPRDAGQRIECHVLDGTPRARLRELLDDAGIVLAVTGPDMPGQGRLDVAPGTVFAQAVHTAGHEVWLGPVTTSGAAPVSPPDLLARCADALPLAGERRSGRIAPQALRAATTVAGHRLVRSVFRQVTGLCAEEPRHVRVDLTTLECTDHHVLAHPLEQPAERRSRDAFMDRLDALEAGRPLDERTLRSRSRPCLDLRTGIFTDVTRAGPAGPPLHVHELAVVDPVGRGRAGTVAGYGMSRASAYRDALLRAFALYGAATCDPRRFTAGGTDRMSARAAAAAFRRGRVDGEVWALDLSTRDAVRVDARRAFPLLPRPDGVAAGLDWEEALTRALLGRARRLALSRLTDGYAALPEIDLADAPLDETASACRDIMAAAGTAPRCHDLSSLTVAPTVGLRLGARTVACASGVSIAAALHEGLLLALAAAQATGDDRPPPSVAPLARVGPGTGVRTDPAPLTAAELTEAFMAQGHRPVAVPLDHDQEVSRILPYVVNVVMCRA
ncbi:hypothetical protein E1295_18200 [Nonomuraea mesophila]|uniref:YcaO domain-containing protein n=1 Tax=Nonomuraea mesophila TaxID=2530382 RepID=A0A4R5FIN7_9ACTN|nr:hypothetical protein [Nonomuraea mesophila]TDE51536.1 hypothetical protein E1295_18200 [Nonomuraea mesophila]